MHTIQLHNTYIGGLGYMARGRAPAARQARGPSAAARQARGPSAPWSITVK